MATGGVIVSLMLTHPLLYLRCDHLATLFYEALILLEEPEVEQLQFQFPNAVCKELHLDTINMCSHQGYK